jgi:hypothetical protein
MEHVRGCSPMQVPVSKLEVSNMNMRQTGTTTGHGCSSMALGALSTIRCHN